MRLYHLKEREADWKRVYDCDVVGEHDLSLPGITCPRCNATWATNGMEYPCVTVPVPLRRRLEPRLATWEEFLELRAKVVDLLPPGTPLPDPGTDFGPLVGRAKGKVAADFNWPRPWTLILKKPVYELLTRRGLHLGTAITPMLRGAERLDVKLVELQVEPRVVLADASFKGGDPARCALCGREASELDRLVVAGTKDLSGFDLVRPANFPTKILGTQRFKEMVEAEGLNNVLFEEVAVE